MSCHTEKGYRSMTKLLQGRNRVNIDKLIKMLHDMPADSPYRKYMPPVVGKPEELDALGAFLATLSAGSQTPVAEKDKPVEVASKATKAVSQ